MLENISTSLAAGSSSLLLVALLTAPSLVSIASHLWSPKRSIPKIYKDKDGVATERSVEEYSAKIPKTFLGIFTIAGLGCSIALAVRASIEGWDGLFVENWLNVAQWALITVQAASIILTRDYLRSYSLGIYSALSSIFLLAVLLFQDGLIARETPSGESFGTTEQLSLQIAQLGLILLVAVFSISLPRRPEVFHDGVPVDGMNTVSALGKYTFGWVEHLLVLSRKKNRLELEDLPKMDQYTRSKDLSEAWAATSHEKKLWIEIFLEHKWSFMVQWFLTLLQAFGNFAPQFVTYHILKILEKRLPGDAVSFEAWIWVVTLTIATIGAAWIESWLFWISWSEVAIPIRAQLAALIFQKAMRRKDVKGASKSAKKDTPAGPDMADASEAATAGDKPELEEDEADPKSKQNTVNLIGVDAKRVADFCSFNNYFPGSLFKLIVSFAFLLSIIGWQALLSGFLAMSLTIPLNIVFSRRYAAAQDRLMKVRDTKMGVVTEALQGIRQIKFSALEANWHEKIGKVRRKELDEQWNVFVSDTFLLFCWISSPIALAATSLAVYAWKYGELTPSVAFTAIGVFASLEVTLAVIPELTTDLIDAFISVERIEKYLAAPEISKNTNHAHNISFEDASIAWPSDEEKEDDDLRYVLRNINVSFPENELSVVSGKTGTGKSLLLAAILGEVDLLDGRINVPQPPQTRDRHDHLANKDNWIIPSAVAFVAQIPWIENASIKDNILFGLPYDEYRYKKVIEVCALKKDLEMLTDGEATEIGANGINLSGGQRWRVTFARALYSRAGILVLDDIFSAVDAHVGRFIFEKGLTGELGVGRTRILVTHHVALCASKTKYIVELGDGTIAQAGLVSELENDGTLQQIISHEENESEIVEDEDPTAVNSAESSDGDAAEIVEPLKKIDSKAVPKKFVEDELREQGRVKTRIYLDYMKYSGGLPFWSIALLAFSLLQIIVTGRAWWIRLWTGNNEKRHTSMIHAFTYSYQVHDLSPHQPDKTLSTTDSQSDNLRFYLGIYIAFSVASIIVGLFRYYFIYTGSIRASRRMFDGLSFTILRTPLRWMDTVPLGRILNRFTADFNVVDSRLANDIGFGANNLFRLIGVIVAG
ncbi:hypothetical protein ONS95_013584 [Cadophora gregata]|uniref:uncharacterized protein n=1 Tax=Cadophora gregata TaxID=51156 RepID=UPI0026DDC31C|nr:uncharacterized protein ONS95_013584 [Cadophora gregata]KAK0113328.1 hypothetical protein ONS96_014193 [Cadophora gregata f. sp. sojae]KAK0114079.1 hypothetical protein ONS95_013584 [Cadophora gregata]